MPLPQPWSEETEYTYSPRSERDWRSTAGGRFCQETPRNVQCDIVVERQQQGYPYSKPCHICKTWGRYPSPVADAYRRSTYSRLKRRRHRLFYGGSRWERTIDGSRYMIMWIENIIEDGDHEHVIACHSYPWQTMARLWSRLGLLRWGMRSIQESRETESKTGFRASQQPVKLAAIYTRWDGIFVCFLVVER